MIFIKINTFLFFLGHFHSSFWYCISSCSAPDWFLKSSLWNILCLQNNMVLPSVFGRQHKAMTIFLPVLEGSWNLTTNNFKGEYLCLAQGCLLNIYMIYVGSIVTKNGVISYRCIYMCNFIWTKSNMIFYGLSISI